MYIELLAVIKYPSYHNFIGGLAKPQLKLGYMTP